MSRGELMCCTAMMVSNAVIQEVYVEIMLIIILGLWTLLGLLALFRIPPFHRYDGEE